MDLDALDRRILDLVRRDARLSARAIGRELGVAAGTVSRRITRMEESRVITGYTVSVDEGRIGRPLGFVVGVQVNQGTEMAGALEELAALPEVDEVAVVTGRWDLLVLGRVAGPAELNTFLRTRLWQSPLFRHGETMLVVERRSGDSALPADHHIDGSPPATVEEHP